MLAAECHLLVVVLRDQRSGYCAIGKCATHAAQFITHSRNLFELLSWVHALGQHMPNTCAQPQPFELHLL